MRQTCERLLQMGALGAKFSGAGGEGSVVALFGTAEDATAAVDALADSGLGVALYSPIP